MSESPSGTMRALILERPGCIALREIPIPVPGPGELLIRVRAATTCGTDLKAFVRGHPQIPMPGVFGHEYSGVVAVAGSGARFREGDAVMGVHSAPCQACSWCRRGQENLCESIMATKVLGSFAEYLLIPERIARLNVFLKPEDLSFERASLLEPLSCVAEGVNHLGVAGESRQRVLVIGAGAIGLMFAAVLRTHEVTVAGRNPSRVAVAQQLGARTSSLEALEADCFDVVIECTGSVDVWERAPAHARRGGLVVLFGGCPSGTRASFDTARLHYDQIALVSPFHFGTASVRRAREWLLEAQDAFGLVLTSERPLDDGPEVFEGLRAGRDIKVVLRP
ncbi:MAG: alcohol dehydrogenase catalytic domain-containing protein [Chthonomonadaceae bacterium]|nr:alcohol dehydrogenase catalytic domain-containing protein [Chthonomonadaceae bacterium]